MPIPFVITIVAVGKVTPIGTCARISPDETHSSGAGISSNVTLTPPSVVGSGTVSAWNSPSVTKFRPKIDDNDFEFKVNNVRRFLGQLDRVKLTVNFRGRELSRTELGEKLLKRILSDLGELAVVEGPSKREGRTVFLMVAPGKAIRALTEQSGKEYKAGEKPALVGGTVTPSGTKEASSNAEDEIESKRSEKV